MNLDFLKKANMEDLANQLFVPTSGYKPGNPPTPPVAQTIQKTESWTQKVSFVTRPGFLLGAIVFMAFCLLGLYWQLHRTRTEIEEELEKLKNADSTATVRAVRLDVNALKLNAERMEKILKGLKATLYSDRIDNLMDLRNPSTSVSPSLIPTYAQAPTHLMESTSFSSPVPPVPSRLDTPYSSTISALGGPSRQRNRPNALSPSNSSFV